jgi:RNA polymerase sigma factor (sigma-70 family)
MNERSNCYCRLCRVERDLLGQCATPAYQEQYAALLGECPALLPFTSSAALLEHLRSCRQESAEQSSDPVFRELLRAKAWFPRLGIVDDLFILAFVPAIHATLRQAFKRHPALSAEDAGQQAVLTLLEFLGSAELHARESHFAFAISRRIKRSLFAWAEEQAGQNSEEAQKSPVEPAEDSFERYALLRHFLHASVVKNWLNDDELDLLIQFKLDGNSGEELGEPAGISGNALRQRVKRLIAKLRRLADARKSASETGQTKNLKLFS